VRPEPTTPPKDELIKLGEELVAWATEEPEKPELRCRFAQWYSLKKGILHKEWDLMLQKPEFRGYYEIAQTALGNRFVDGSVKDSIGHRFMRRYCPEVRIQEDQDHTDKLERELAKKLKEIEFEAKQKQINETPPLADTIDMQNENMLLKARIAELESKIADQP